MVVGGEADLETGWLNEERWLGGLLDLSFFFSGSGLFGTR